MVPVIYADVAMVCILYRGGQGSTSAERSTTPIMILDSSDDDAADTDVDDSIATPAPTGGGSRAGAGADSDGGGGSGGGGAADASPVSVVDLTSPASAYGGGSGGGGGAAATPVSSLKSGRTYRDCSPIQESASWTADAGACEGWVYLEENIK